MGSWGAGAFDNDEALDFAAEVETVDDIARVLTLADSEGQILHLESVDADHSTRIIVASECVAAMRGHPCPGLPEDLAARLRGLGKPSLELRALANSNLSTVLRQSELLDLWNESDAKGDFARATTDLIERLCRPAGKLPRKSRKKRPFNSSPCMFCHQELGQGQLHRLELTLADDTGISLTRGGWVHLGCVNAALHTRHMIQNWQLDDDQLKWIADRI